MRVLVLAILLPVGVLGAARAAHAVDPIPICLTKEMVAAGKAVRAIAACNARAVKLGGAVDAACVEAAHDALGKTYHDAELRYLNCTDDDGLDRVTQVVDDVVAEAVRRLAPATGASRCQAKKIVAASLRAEAALRALANVQRYPNRLSTRRRQKLVRGVRGLRARFEKAFRKLEARGGCLTTGDAPAAGAAVDAGLDAIAAALAVVGRETVSLPSPVAPPHTPGTPGVTVGSGKLATQFGGAGFNLNNVTFTRWRIAGIGRFTPDAILVTVAGFGGGAGNFEALAQNLVTRLLEEQGLLVEVWGYDRRTEQLEDRTGALLAGTMNDPLVALDWYYGDELGLTLAPALASGPNRRAVFYNATDDVPFIADWTSLVFSRDIDAVVEVARADAHGNVFLGGHSAGTGFAARYAATDFDLTGDGPPDPGYAKLRGLVLFEGGGGTTQTPALTDDSLDRIVAKADGGLFGAVRDGAPRCVDGSTPCTIATEAVDCAGQEPPKCTPAVAAHGVILGISPKVLASAEPVGIQALLDPDGGQAIVQVDQGAPGNNAIAKVPELVLLAALPAGTAEGLFGYFLDDDGITAAVAPAVAASIGAPGPTVNGLATWLDVRERASFPPCPGAGCATPDNGPAPTAIPTSATAAAWGHEKEVVRLDRLRSSFAGVKGANASDWYYPVSGLSVTSVAGVCAATACAVGDVGATCATDADCGQAISLDSTALSVGRGRRDIENLTQAAHIDVPVLAIGGSNGLTTVPGRYLPFATSLGACAAPSCDGTARVVDPAAPSAAFPTFGGVGGGFEVVIAEGFAHIDVVAAEDDADNPVVAALAAFIARNLQ